MNVELKFKEWFSEAARWKSSPWAKPSNDFWDRLEKWNKPEFFVHFESSSPTGVGAGKHLGVNVSSNITDKSTPRGLYGFPISYIFETADTLGIYDSGEDWVDFAEGAPHVWIFKAKNPDRVLHMRKGSDDNAKLYLMVQDDVRKVLYGDMRGTSAIIGDTGSLMTTSFLRMGIDGFVDWGTNTIHPSEPYQCVFFGSGKVQIVDSFENTEWFKDKPKTTVGAPEAKPVKV